MMSRIRYSENSVKQITENVHFELEKEVINIINFLAHKVGAPSYKKTPNFKKKHTQHVDRITGDDWAAIRNFKKTVINKNTEGIALAIDEIRCLLNKITNDSYSTILGEILEKIKISKDTFNFDEFSKIGKLIFEIGSKNKHCSHLYAQLYNELTSTYDVFNEICTVNYEIYSKIFDTFNYVGPEDDYNLYCDYNKENENRKTMSLFFVNLMKHNVFDVDKIVALISQLIEKVETLVIEENKQEIVEEIVNNLLIMVKEGYEQLSDEKYWEPINSHINKMTSMKKSDASSYTTKIKFKYMDLLDEIE
jgi:hypothetical protein